LRKNVWATRVNSQRLLNDFGNCVLVDTTLLTVAGLKPISEFLCTFAGIARQATSSYVLASDKTCVVDDVLPRCDIFARTSCRHSLNHLDATIDASFVSLSHLILEPARNAPIIHTILLTTPNLFIEQPEVVNQAHRRPIRFP